jgi:hypothetical protein
VVFERVSNAGAGQTHERQLSRKTSTILRDISTTTHRYLGTLFTSKVFYLFISLCRLLPTTCTHRGITGTHICHQFCQLYLCTNNPSLDQPTPADLPIPPLHSSTLCLDLEQKLQKASIVSLCASYRFCKLFSTFYIRSSGYSDSYALFPPGSSLYSLAPQNKGKQKEGRSPPG